MDDIRGLYGSGRDAVGEVSDLAEAAAETHEQDVRMEPPPEIGKDERRMQVRAYNHWASLLRSRNFPSIEDLDPDQVPDFGPFSVLLDFTGGIENPAIAYLGAELGTECGVAGTEIQMLDDVPARSLLSRITDHYMQILANQAPIGFEAEFINQRAKTILYRGILLPFSSDDDTIDFIYGVINWKEAADTETSDALADELHRALEEEPMPAARRDLPITDWADGPAVVGAAAKAILSGSGQDYGDEEEREFGDEQGWDEESEAAEIESVSTAEHVVPEPAANVVAPIIPNTALSEAVSVPEMPVPSFETLARDDVVVAPVAEEPLELDAAWEEEPLELGAAFTLPDDGAELGLFDQLAIARELAQTARGSEDRTRNALYQAVSRAYDFALAADDQPEELAEIMEDAGIAAQDRAPMTPIVKLVFGVDYDKTRITEYATVLSHARRVGLASGTLGDYLARQQGGVKSLVAAERKWRKGEDAQPEATANQPRDHLARKLRKLDPVSLESLPSDGAEFALVMARRLDDGTIVLLGEVPHDVPLIEKAARRLLVG